VVVVVGGASAAPVVVVVVVVGTAPVSPPTPAPVPAPPPYDVPRKGEAVVVVMVAWGVVPKVGASVEGASCPRISCCIGVGFSGLSFPASLPLPLPLPLAWPVLAAAAGVSPATPPGRR
jgi:hypothetical protein